MDKTSKRILDCLSKAPDYTIFYYDDWPDEISDIDDTVIFAAIRYLTKKELCEICRNQHGTSIGVCLSHEGIHQDEFIKIRRREFLYNSVAVPIIVALLTTLITTACAYYWSKLTAINASMANTAITETTEINTEVLTPNVSE